MENSIICCSYFLLVLSLFISYSEAHTFYAGGKDGWVLHPSESYSAWTSRNRFQINDTIVFQYKNGEDSVLVVNQQDYDQCNLNNPVQKMDTGNSVFTFDRSGAFFFVSGTGDRCKQGEKLAVIVLAARTKIPVSPSTPPVGPSPVPSSSPVAPPPHSPVSSPPASPVPSSSPVAPPKDSPASSPSISPVPSSSPVAPPKDSPASSPSISPVPSSSPVAPPKDSPASSPSISPVPSSSPVAPPKGSPASSPSISPVAPPKNSPVSSPKTSPSPFLTPASSPSVSPGPSIATPPSGTPGGQAPGAQSPANSPNQAGAAGAASGIRVSTLAIGFAVLIYNYCFIN